MNIHTALRKINTLTEGELKHCIQRMDMEISYYYVCSKNDPPDRMERFSLPYLKRLQDTKQKFVERLKSYE